MCNKTSYPLFSENIKIIVTNEIQPWFKRRNFVKVLALHRTLSKPLYLIRRKYVYSQFVWVWSNHRTSRCLNVTLPSLISIRYISIRQKYCVRLYGSLIRDMWAYGSSSIPQTSEPSQTVAELRGRPGVRPLLLNIFSISCSFWEILAKPDGWRPLLWGILDPPLLEFSFKVFLPLSEWKLSHKT